MKKIKKVLVVVGVILLCFGLFTACVCHQYKKRKLGEKTDFASIEEFEEYGGTILVELPVGARDIKYYYDKGVLTYSSIYSFVVSDEEEYDAFMELIKDTVCNVPEGRKDKPSWEYYIEKPYTEDELEEMAYLEKHYLEMDYKEILSMSRHRYGFFSGYGALVSDYTNMEYSLSEFPMRDCFDYVVEESLENYTILRYYPQDSGSSAYGIIVDEKDRKFVVFYFGSAK